MKPFGRGRKTPGGRLYSAPGGEEVLAELGLASVADVEAYDGGEVVAAGRHRRVRRIRLADGSKVFLKQSFRGGRGELLAQLLRSGRRRTSSRVEAENAFRLEAAGIAVAPVLAWGERARLVSEDFSFILTREARGRDLGSIVEDGPLLDDRALLRQMVALVARFEGARLHPDDLVPRHVFVDPEADGGPRLVLIDMHRISRGRGADPELRARMLARLHAELPLAAVGSGARFRFLRQLAGKEGARRLAPLVVKAAEPLFRRRAIRRNLLGGRRQPWPAEKRFCAGQLAIRADRLDDVLALGFDPEAADAAHARIAALDATTGCLGFAGSAYDCRVLFNTHYALHGQVATPALLARFIPQEDGERGWVLREVPGGEALQDHLRARPDRAPVLLPAIDRALSVLLLLGILPCGRLLDWLRVDGDQVLVAPAPPIDLRLEEGTGRDRDLRERLRLEFEAAGLVGAAFAALCRGLRLSRPGLLGSHRPIS